MDAFHFDLRYAVRSLQTSPGFTFLAVVMLALGIGATTLVYGVLDAVVLRPLPCPAPDRMVLVVESHPQRGKMLVRPANYEDWRRRAPWLEQSGMAFGTSFVLTGEGRHIAGALADDGFFQTWGVLPQLGRGFLADDYRRPIAADFFGQRGDVAILSDGLWKRRFGADPLVLGQTIALDGVQYTIVGVMPPSFRVINHADVFVPWIVGAAERTERRFHFFPVVVRLRPSVSREQAQNALSTVYRSLAADHPEDSEWSVELDRPRELMLGTTPEVLAMLLGAVSLVLLIACANIANLLLARGMARRRDNAIRLALGSTRSRLVVQHLLEGGLLAFTGALCGTALAIVGVRLVALLPAISELPFAFIPSIDLRVLLFTSAITAACVLLCAAVPACADSRVELRQAFTFSRGSYRSPGAHGTRSMLVVGEVALGVVVVVIAMLMTKSLVRLHDIDPGVQTERLLTFQVEPSSGSHGPSDVRYVYQQILDRLHALPAVQRVALTGYLPLTDPGRTWRFSIERRPSTRSGDEYFAVPAEVSHEFFSALGITKIAGRLFDGTDRADSPAVTVISETAARRYWPTEPAIGQRIRVAGVDRWFSVIGIVADVRQARLQDNPAPALYTLWDQMPDAMQSATVIVQTDGAPLSVMPVVGNVLRQIDTSLAVDDIRTMAVVRRTALRDSTFRTGMLASFAALALFLGAIGIYGVMAQFIGERRHEMAIRVALGATGRNVVALVATHAGRLVGVGIALGVVTAVTTTRLLGALLFNISATDATSFALTVFVFLAMAALATYIPARRAMRVDPMSALRSE
jgi:putative ABC transport system permease protein